MIHRTLERPRILDVLPVYIRRDELLRRYSRAVHEAIRVSCYERHAARIRVRTCLR